MSRHLDMTKAEIADFLAAKAVAAATAFLDGRSDAAAMARQADDLLCELLAITDEPDCNAIADPTRLLVIAMMRASIAAGPRLTRWRAIMEAIVDLVRLESRSQPRRGTPEAPGNAEILRGARAE